MKKHTLSGVAAVALAGLLTSGAAEARDQIQIVGSSTVFPFATAVAEQFGQKTEFNTPVIESTGSGGGLKLFCSGVGLEHPDVTNASRAIKDSEVELCASNGVTEVTEFRIGFDGIVLGNSVSGPSLSLTKDQIFRALAKQLPDESGNLVPNPNVNWSDIDASLPAAKIEVLGPPPTSGTRDAFVELVMEKACLEGMDEDVCAQIREDGGYVEAGENDNLIVQKLEANPAALGIFGFSFLDQNASKIKGATVNGVEPTFDNIASGEYAVSRSLYFYVKKAHVGVVPGIAEYVTEFANAATDEEGYLVDKGLIPLPEDEAGALRALPTTMPHNVGS
ncbi:MAG: substrate-binding domain-containing protein [Pseudomonadota bacterium]